MQQITSRKNPVVQRFRSLIREKRARDEAREFVTEGSKLIKEGLKCGLKLGDTVLVTKQAAEKNSELIQILENECDIIEINSDLSEYISDTKSPQGIFGVFGFIHNSYDITEANRIIALDSLQDPGNIGTIIRTCDAFGIKTVLLSESCGDIYSPKIIRSAMGSMFRQGFRVCENLSETLLNLKNNNFIIYGALLDESAKKLGTFDFSEKCVILIGNEGNGISPEIQKLCDEKVYIPISGAESLNAAAAAAVICWELVK